MSGRAIGKNASGGGVPAYEQRSDVMNVDRAVMAFAGLMILGSLALAMVHSPYWLLLTAFVGLNLLQAAVTGFCPAAIVLKRLGLRAGCAFG